MSASLLLRVFVRDRLSAAAEEIFKVFERTIVKYEEEASCSKQEIDRLTRLLQDFSSQHNTDLPQSSVLKVEDAPECLPSEQLPNLCTDLTEPELRHIKEEDQEVWDDRHDGEQVREGRDANDSCPTFSNWEKPEEEEGEEDVKLSLPDQTVNGDIEEPHEELAESRSPQSLSHFASSRDEEEQDRQAATASLRSNQAETEHNDSSSVTRRRSKERCYRCSLCNESFSSNNYLINHALSVHSLDSNFLCGLCGESTESAQKLSDHLMSHRTTNVCGVCGKCFKSSMTLVEHMTTHTGVKLHRCHVCGKECRRRGDLKIHIRIHTGEKPYGCSFCDKGFTHSGHLRKHMMTHTGERPHRCGVCGKGFLQSAHLKCHLGTHIQKC